MIRRNWIRDMIPASTPADTELESFITAIFKRDLLGASTISTLASELVTAIVDVEDDVGEDIKLPGGGTPADLVAKVGELEILVHRMVRDHDRLSKHAGNDAIEVREGVETESGGPGESIPNTLSSCWVTVRQVTRLNWF